jgi:SAM-dependent methyltransferase
VAEALYDLIGDSYATSRREDPRLAALIREALGDAESVVNVGAGTGDYEPRDMRVVAVEPSRRMIEQRDSSRVPAQLGRAEALPLEDGAVDAAMAVLSDHHWTDRSAGLREMRRVARKRVVIVNSHPGLADLFWLTRDYLPAFHDLIPADLKEIDAWPRLLSEALGPVEMKPLLVPHDCVDGFYPAFWRRPQAYLQPELRANISVFHRLDGAVVRGGLERLQDDLASGAWHGRNTTLLGLSAADMGLRIVVAEIA